jgi:hypothetical protein
MLDDLRAYQDAYFARVEGNRAMMLPPEAMLVLLEILDAVQPGVVLEQGCGWSTTQLVRWGYEHHVPVMTCESDPAWQAALRKLLMSRNLEPNWVNISVWAGYALEDWPWVALVDGDIDGRKQAVLDLYVHAARGAILFDDANADYVQVAMSPLLTAQHGQLYDLKSRTLVRRNQETWCALWVGALVQERLATLLKGLPVCE